MFVFDRIVYLHPPVRLFWGLGARFLSIGDEGEVDWCCVLFFVCSLPGYLIPLGAQSAFSWYYFRIFYTLTTSSVR